MLHRLGYHFGHTSQVSSVLEQDCVCSSLTPHLHCDVGIKVIIGTCMSHGEG